MPDVSWKERGLCSPATAHLFFSELDFEQDEAKRICRACPVAVTCLEEALVGKERGVWGGLTEDERRRLERRLSQRRLAG